jgi:hypothetical protein
MLPRYVPLVEIAYSSELHHRWYEAYNYHVQRLVAQDCDRRCKMIQRQRMSLALRRAMIAGVHYAQGLAIQCDCNEQLITTLTHEYLDALGVPHERIAEVRGEMERAAFERELMTRLYEERLHSNN